MVPFSPIVVNCAPNLSAGAERANLEGSLPFLWKPLPGLPFPGISMSFSAERMTLGVCVHAVYVFVT